MQPSPDNHVRLAHPSSRFSETLVFWVEGVGLQILGRQRDEHNAGLELAFLGWPEAAWHLELVETIAVPPTPTVEDLLVLYVEQPIEPSTIARIERANGLRVPAHNPYWDTYGVTFADPDGYRCVLSTRSWS